MTDAQLAAIGAALIAKYGKPVEFFRDGAGLAKSVCYEKGRAQADDPTSMLAQTAQTRLTLQVAPTKASLQVGDTLILEKVTYTISKVAEYRPGKVTFYVDIEVV